MILLLNCVFWVTMFTVGLFSVLALMVFISPSYSNRHILICVSAAIMFSVLGVVTDHIKKDVLWSEAKRLSDFYPQKEVEMWLEINKQEISSTGKVHVISW